MGLYPLAAAGRVARAPTRTEAGETDDDSSAIGDGNLLGAAVRQARTQLGTLTMERRD